MSIIPASRLSQSDLELLGNNLRPCVRRESVPRRRRKLVLKAVNRSLASIGEQVTRLHRPLLAAS